MKVIKTDIEGLVVLEPNVLTDGRGYFFESFLECDFRENVCDTTFVQDNQSKSLKNVLRGLHFQNPPYSQGKLVRVASGSILDVAVDIRKGSPTYGKYFAVELSGDNNKQLFIPRGFAHGFVVLSDEAILQYKCDNYYNKESEGSILWNDCDLAINWGVSSEDVTISDKDSKAVKFKDFISQFIYE